MEALISPYIIDHVLGMHVLTYPKPAKCVDAAIDRPSGFKVVEVINGSPATTLMPTICSDEGARYFVYLVEKVGVPTMEVATELRSLLMCSRATYLGLKEADAIAHQILIVKDCRRVKPVVKRRKWEARLILCSRARPYFGHDGNEFSITFRSPQYKLLLNRIAELTGSSDELPLLNFFGYQRFGTHRPITHLIGAALLRGEEVPALSMLCEETLAWSGPPRKGYERMICEHGKLKKLSKELKRLFIQSYQSYIFNKALSLTWIELIKDHDDIASALRYLINRECPLIAYSIELGELWEPLASSYNRALSLEGIDLDAFSSPEARRYLRAERRPCISIARILGVEERNGSITLRIFLPRGSYVTVLFRELGFCSIEKLL